MTSSPPFRHRPTIVPDLLFTTGPVLIDRPAPPTALRPPNPVVAPSMATGLLAFTVGMMLAAVVVGSVLWFTSEPLPIASLGVFSVEH